MKKYIVTVNGEKYEVEVEEASSNGVPAPEVHSPAPAATPATPAPAPAAPVAGGEQIKAPMPGKILDIKISAGQQVKKGDVLFILEAMKMENEIMAGGDGTVLSVNTSNGTMVNTGDILAVIK